MSDDKIAYAGYGWRFTPDMPGYYDVLERARDIEMILCLNGVSYCMEDIVVAMDDCSETPDVFVGMFLTVGNGFYLAFDNSYDVEAALAECFGAEELYPTISNIGKLVIGDDMAYHRRPRFYIFTKSKGE